MSVTNLAQFEWRIGQPADPELVHEQHQRTSLHPLTSALVSANSASALPQDTFTPASQTESVASSAQAAGLFSGPKTSALPSSSTAVGAQGVTNSTAEIAAPSNASANSQAGSNNSSASGGSDAGAQTASTSQDAAATSTASTSAASDSASSVIRRRQRGAADATRFAQQCAGRARTQRRGHSANRSGRQLDQRLQSDRVYQPRVPVGSAGAKLGDSRARRRRRKTRNRPRPTRRRRVLRQPRARLHPRRRKVRRLRRNRDRTGRAFSAQR